MADKPDFEGSAQSVSAHLERSEGNDMYYLLPIILVVIWATALIGLCSRRDIDVHTKISWLVVVIVLLQPIYL